MGVIKAVRNAVAFSTDSGVRAIRRGTSGAVPGIGRITNAPIVGGDDRCYRTQSRGYGLFLRIST